MGRSGGGHRLLDGSGEAPDFTLEEASGCLDPICVRILVDLPRTRCRTDPEFVIETGPIPIGELVVRAAPEAVGFPDRLDDGVEALFVGIGPEDGGGILGIAGDLDARVPMIGELYERIRFIVSQPDVVSGLVPFDEVRFEQQCLRLGICDGDLELSCLLEHRLDSATSGLAIASEAIAKVDGFADVHWVIVSIVKEVHTRFPGYLRQAFTEFSRLHQPVSTVRTVLRMLVGLWVLTLRIDQHSGSNQASDW